MKLAKIPLRFSIVSYPHSSKKAQSIPFIISHVFFSVRNGSSQKSSIASVIISSQDLDSMAILSMLYANFRINAKLFFAFCFGSLLVLPH